MTQPREGTLWIQANSPRTILQQIIEKNFLLFYLKAISVQCGSLSYKWTEWRWTRKNACAFGWSLHDQYNTWKCPQNSYKLSYLWSGTVVYIGALCVCHLLVPADKKMWIFPPWLQLELNFNYKYLFLMVFLAPVARIVKYLSLVTGQYIYWVEIPDRIDDRADISRELVCIGPWTVKLSYQCT